MNFVADYSISRRVIIALVWTFCLYTDVTIFVINDYKWPTEGNELLHLIMEDFVVLRLPHHALYEMYKSILNRGSFLTKNLTFTRVINSLTHTKSNQ